jgi:putative endonuclease
MDNCRSTPSLSRGKWRVYIAKAKTGRYYTGITTDTKKRIIKHNSGKGSKFAREQGPFLLIYESETFLNKSEARKREDQIKGWSRYKKEKLIKGEWK